jgi:hypothetical protein
MLAGTVMVASPRPAAASAKGRRNTALALTGLAAYGLLKGKTTLGVAAGVGAAYAWSRYEKKRRQESSARRYRAWRSGYASGRYASRSRRRRGYVRASSRSRYYRRG